MDVVSDTIKDPREAEGWWSILSPLNSPTWFFNNSDGSRRMAVSYHKLKQMVGSIAAARCGVYATAN